MKTIAARILTLVICEFAFVGCSGLIPAGTAVEMNGTPTDVKNIQDYPENLAYRIDDHRYITIKGNDGREGTIYYYDTRLGVRTAVAATGLTLGDGAFGGYYAVDSEYVAIPAIVFFQTNGPLLYVHYSNNGGRTFNEF
ncbi:T6SS immunity protein Tli3 family protein [Caballeronia sp.]|uniref:T6SS immunity protein Tli3 family protein n=1 Tax=Caballeronia sp. TaxID=1931223 RepID=UPI003C44C58B